MSWTDGPIPSTSRHSCMYIAAMNSRSFRFWQVFLTSVLPNPYTKKSRNQFDKTRKNFLEDENVHFKFFYPLFLYYWVCELICRTKFVTKFQVPTQTLQTNDGFISSMLTILQKKRYRSYTFERYCTWFLVISKAWEPLLTIGFRH